MDVSGKAALVTGGGSGLGEGAARALAAAGAKVAVLDFNAEKGARVAAEIGGLFCETNVADPGQVDAAIAKAEAAHGVARVVVNCAGIASAAKTAGRDKKTGEIRIHPLDNFQTVMMVNLFGTFQVSAKAAARMLAHDPVDAQGQRGVIVNTASVAAQDGQIGQLAYAASKGGIVSMTLPMARDLAPEGVRVMTILPGFFETPIYELLPPQVKENLRAHVQFPNRFGRVDEFADLVLTICRNDYFNGECIRLDAAARMPPR